MQHDGAAKTLVDHFASFEERNRQLAIDGLLRNPQRAIALLEALEHGAIPCEAVTGEQYQSLLEALPPDVRARGQAMAKASAEGLPISTK
jgi:hypothetical protein